MLDSLVITVRASWILCLSNASMTFSTFDWTVLAIRERNGTSAWDPSRPRFNPALDCTIGVRLATADTAPPGSCWTLQPTVPMLKEDEFTPPECCVFWTFTPYAG